MQKLIKLFTMKYSFWVIFFGLLLLKSGFFLFKYYPVMDDWFLFVGNSVFDDKWGDLILKNGMLGLRPLAGLTDVFIIGGLFVNNLSFVYFFLTVMFGVSVMLFSKTFEDNKIPAGPIFCLVFAFLPMSSEALYWMSASSRIITSFFFIALSLFFLNKYLKQKKGYKLALFTLFSFLSVNYYEATIPLSITCPAIILFLNIENKKSLKSLISGMLPVLIPVAAVAVIGLYYLLSPGNSDVSQRGSLVTSNFGAHCADVLKGFVDCLGKESFSVFADSYAKGFNTIFAGKSYVFLALTLINLLAFGSVITLNEREKAITAKDCLAGIAAGLILLIAGLGIHFLLSFFRPAFRVAFIGLFGLGIIMESLFELILRKRIVISLLSAALAFLLIIANVGELAAYKTTSLLDNAIAKDIIDIDQNGYLFRKDKVTFLLGGEKTFASGGRLYYEHIQSSLGAYASITGIIRYLTGTEDINNVVPLTNGDSWGIDTKKQELYFFLGLDENYRVIELDFTVTNGEITLFTKGGAKYGVLSPNNGGQMTFYQ